MNKEIGKILFVQFSHCRPVIFPVHVCTNSIGSFSVTKKAYVFLKKGLFVSEKTESLFF